MDTRIEKGKRLRKARIMLGLTQEDVAIKLGITQSAIGRTERGISSLKASNLKKLNEAYAISVEYIQTGKGEMIENQGDVKGMSKIQLISGSVLAGLSDSNRIQDYNVEETLYLPLGSDKQCYAIRVEGKSMEPTAYEGSVVILEQMKERNDFVDNKPYVIIFQGIAFLKRVSMIIGGEHSGKFKIESDNEDKVQIAAGEDISAWYRVTHVINQV